MIPCIIITRDRVTYLKKCIASLRQFPLSLHIVDHGSTYGPMLDYLDVVSEPVYRLESASPRDLWQTDIIAELTNDGFDRYVVTDPDIVLSASCPADWVRRAETILKFNPRIVKCGPSLRIDDLPRNPLTRAVYDWERQFWQVVISDSYAYSAPIDTTLAVYRPLRERPTFELGPGARLRPPYTALHLPWYEEGEPDEELIYYRKHALPGASYWEGVRSELTNV